jgi:hypothetical protein
MHSKTLAGVTLGMWIASGAVGAGQRAPLQGGVQKSEKSPVVSRPPDRPGHQKYRTGHGVVLPPQKPRPNTPFYSAPPRAGHGGFTAPPGGNTTGRTGKGAQHVRLPPRQGHGTNSGAQHVSAAAKQPGGNTTQRTGKQASAWQPFVHARKPAKQSAPAVRPTRTPATPAPHTSVTRPIHRVDVTDKVGTPPTRSVNRVDVSNKVGTQHSVKPAAPAPPQGPAHRGDLLRQTSPSPKPMPRGALLRQPSPPRSTVPAPPPPKRSGG